MEEQRFTDTAMCARIIAVVEKSIADAEPPRPFRDTVDGYERVYAPFEGTKTRLVAARIFGGGRTVWELEGRLLDQPDVDCTLNACDAEPGVAVWWPGNCDIPMAQYLAWWEGIVEIDESAKRRYEVTYKAGAFLPASGEAS